MTTTASTLSVRKASKDAGFTIVEVMMAGVVMLAGIVGMIQVLTSGAEMLDVSRKQTIAAQIIQSRIDQFRGSIPADWSQVSNGTTTTNLATSSFSTIALGFTCIRDISDLKPDGTLKRLSYTVTWTGKNGRIYTRSGSTTIGKNGLHVAYQRS